MKKNKKSKKATKRNNNNKWRKPGDCDKVHVPRYLTHWKTREGDVLAIREMQFDHLLNARALLRRKIANFSEIEESLSSEVARRCKNEYKQYAGIDPKLFTLLEAAKQADPMGKYADAWDDSDDHHGQS